MTYKQNKKNHLKFGLGFPSFILSQIMGRARHPVKIRDYIMQECYTNEIELNLCIGSTDMVNHHQNVITVIF